MFKYKKAIIPVFTVIVALVLTIVVSAFNNKHGVKSTKLANFDYVMISGDPSDPADRTNPDNYQKQTGTISCPSGSAQFCKINAADDGTVNHKPVIPNPSALRTALINSNQTLPAPLTNQVWLKP